MTLDLTKTAERFTLGFVPVLKTSQADGKRRLHGVASSTVRDRHGDVMSKTALEDMLEQSNSGLTIFLNHSYNVPEDVAGTVEKASLRRVSDDIHDLSFDIVINERNARAVEAWEAMHEQGTKLGLSIGAMIPEGGAKVDRKTGTYTIDHVELVETSIVGVPANPRSWVEYAAKALRKATQPEFTPLVTSTWIGDTTGSISTTDYKFSIGDPPSPDSDDGESDGDDTNVEPPPIHPTPESEYEPPAEPVTTDDINDAAVNEDGSDQAEAERKKSHPPVDQTPKQDPVDPPEQDDRDEVKDHEVEPPPISPVPGEPAPEEPVTTDDLLKLADAATGKATVSVETPYANITVDTGNRGKDTAASSTTSQEAPESAPETEESASAPEYPWMGIPGNPPVQQAIESIATRELEQSALVVTQLSSELSRVTKELSTERNLRITAERERDEASRDLTKVLRETDEMLKKLAATPVGKRTTYHEAVGRYEAIKTYYGEEFTDHLARSME